MKLSPPLFALVFCLCLVSCRSEGGKAPTPAAAPGADAANPAAPATPPPGTEEISEDRFQKEIAKDPNDMVARYNLANLLSAQGKHREAAAEYERVVAGDAKDFDALARLGNARMALGDHAAAIDAYKRAAEVSPQSAEIRVRLADALARAGRAEEAAAERVAAARLNPNEAGKLLVGERKYEEAVAELQKVGRKNAETYLLIGDAYFGLKKFAEAAAAYQQAVRRDPKSSATYFQLGNAHNQLQQHKEAAAAFQQAARLAPTDADAFFNLGNAYAKLRQYREGADAYAQALKLNPSDAQARYSLALLHLDNGNLAGAQEHLEPLKGADAKLAEQLAQLIAQRQATR